MNEIEIGRKRTGNYTAPVATQVGKQGENDVRDPLRST
jgi:hypothetical protein